MARSISPTLTAAQELRERRPYISLTAYARIYGGVRREIIEDWYDGAENAGPHASVVSSDGSLTRIRIDGTFLYRDRVTTPTSGADYTNWTAWINPIRLCAICHDGAGNLSAFAVLDTAPTLVLELTSVDHGATWSGATLAFTHSETVTMIAADYDGANRVVIVNTGNNLSAYKDTGAGFGAAVTSSDGEITLGGIAMYHQADWNVIITGTDASTGAAIVATRIFGDGIYQASNTWSANRTVITAASGTAITFHAPHGARIGTHRLSYREQFTGTGAYSRLMFSTGPPSANFDENRWREPYPIDYDDDFGLDIAFDGTHVLLTNAARIFRWPVAVASVAVPDSAIAYINNPTSTFGTEQTTILIDNSDGAYDAPGIGDLLALITGAELELRFGYVTASGNETTEGPRLHVNTIEQYVDDHGHKYLLITADTAFAILDRFKAPRAVRYTGQTYFTIMLLEIARGGFDFSANSTSTPFITLTPEVIIPAGTSTLALLKRLYARVDDTLYQRGADIFNVHTDPTDTAQDWDFSFAVDGDHEIIGPARYTTHRLRSNHVRVIGGPAADVIGETHDFAAILEAPGAPDIVANRGLTTAATADDEAETRLHAVKRSQVLAQIRAPLHCGVELSDIIQTNDARCGIVDEQYRVTAHRVIVERRRRRATRYDVEIEMGAV